MAGQGATFRFGAFTIRPESGELWHGGRRVRLAPQPFQVLSLIVEARGELVARKEVRDAVWADGTTVEFDQGLNYCLRQIRLALQDDARHPTYVETVPKRGYRLLAPVTVLPGPSAASEAPEPSPGAKLVGRATGQETTLDRRSRRNRLVVAAAIAAMSTTVVWWGVRSDAAPPVISAEAQRLFQEAEYLAGTWESAKVEEAAERYRAAIALEPRFAEAWAGLTNADIVLSYGGGDRTRALAEAERHARRALELDGTSAAGHAALGHSYWHQWRWSGADAELRQAVALDGRSAVAHQLYGLYLASAGRVDEARQHAVRAVELAPTSGLINYSLAQVYLQTGDFEAAILQAERTLQVDRFYPLAFGTLIRANVQLGRHAAAVDAVDAASRVGFGGGIEVWHAYLLAVTGSTDQARTILASRRTGRSRPQGSIGEAAVFVALGEPDAALRTLDEAVEARVQSLLWLATAPELESLHAFPRFNALVSRVRGPAS